MLAIRGILRQVELGTGRFLHRIGDASDASGGGQGPFLVRVSGQDFRIDGIAGTAFAPFLDPRSIAGVGVAALDHEPVDDPVEQDAVIVVREGQPDEVVPVLGRVLVQFDADGAHGSDNVEDRFLGQTTLEVVQRDGVSLRSFQAGLGSRSLGRIGRQGIGLVSVGIFPMPASAGGGQENEDREREIALHLTNRWGFLPGTA